MKGERADLLVKRESLRSRLPVRGTRRWAAPSDEGARKFRRLGDSKDLGAKKRNVVYAGVLRRVRLRASTAWESIERKPRHLALNAERKAA